MSQAQYNFVGEHYINISLEELSDLMHNTRNLNLIMYQYIFIIIRIPVNLLTRRLFENMRYGLGEYFLEDMRTLMGTLSMYQLRITHDFINYISANRRNPNLHNMIIAYNNNN